MFEFYKLVDHFILGLMHDGLKKLPVKAALSTVGVHAFNNNYTTPPLEITT